MITDQKAGLTLPDAWAPKKAYEDTAPKGYNKLSVAPRVVSADEQFWLDSYGSSKLYSNSLLSDNAKSSYVGYVWQQLNRKVFGSKLKVPDFKWTNQKFAGPDVLGYWQPATKTLSLHRKLFNAVEVVTLYVVIHEVCHQAVTEIDRINEYEQDKGHGPAWKAHMLKCRAPATLFLPYQQEEMLRNVRDS